jgi:hypothetical protein
LVSNTLYNKKSNLPIVQYSQKDYPMVSAIDSKAIAEAEPPTIIKFKPEAKVAQGLFKIFFTEAIKVYNYYYIILFVVLAFFYHHFSEGV